MRAAIYVWKEISRGPPNGDGPNKGTNHNNKPVT